MGGQGFLRPGKQVGHPRTEIGIGATGEDEGERQDLPAKIRQSDDVAQFIGQRVVGQHGSGFEQGHGGGDADGRGSGYGIGVRADDLDAVDPPIVGGDQHAEGDLITRFETVEFLRLFDIEGHGHGRHEAGDFFVLHHHRTTLGLDPPDHSADRILTRCFFSRRGTGRGGGGCRLAANTAKGEGCGEEHRRQPRKPLHAGVIVIHSSYSVKGEDPSGNPPIAGFTTPLRRSRAPGPSPHRPAWVRFRCCGRTRPACRGGWWDWSTWVPRGGSVPALSRPMLPA